METSFDESIIQRTSINEQITQYMQEAILKEKWKINEKIPSEAELASFFKVSKLTVRVALQQLIGMGVLEKRIGDGTYVKKFDFVTYAQKGFSYYMHPELLDQICDFRLGIELKCCELAIKCATAEEFDQLKAKSIEFSQKVRDLSKIAFITEEDYEQIVLVDIEFHRQICIMSHNELLLNAFDMSKELITQYAKTVFKKRILFRIQNDLDIAKIRDIHRDIYEALAAHNYEKCAANYIEMIDRENEL